MSIKTLLPFFIIYAVIALLLLSLQQLLLRQGVYTALLHGANALFLIMNILVFFIQKKALANPNPNAFIRSVMAGMMIKMFVTIAAVFIYVAIAGKSFNMTGILSAMLLYFVYLGTEVFMVSKLQKQKNA